MKEILKPKVLFIVKCREQPYTNERLISSGEYTNCMTSGLYNSANFVNQMLNEHGVESHLVQVIDNNQIDREVTKYKPTHVMIEALWVVPEKFKILSKLHPNVKWIIRIHSEVAFIANEGIAFQWLNEYIKLPNVTIAPNSERFMKDICNYFKASYETLGDKLVYLPNYYWKDKEVDKLHNPYVVNVGCFGSIRPLKNQLIQALGAVEYVRHTDKKLRFHINSTRVEQNGNPVLHNIKSLFAGLDKEKYELVEHDWLKHEHFIREVRKMDVCLQVSYSETFNLCQSDAVCQDIPVVVSDEIFWVSDFFKAKTDDAKDIADKIKRALTLGKFGAYLNKRGLEKYNRKSVKAYLEFLHNC